MRFNWSKPHVDTTMKIKRYKQARRVLNFYKRNFGLRQPYQVIVDGTFTQAALKGKIQLKEQLPKYFGGEIKLVTTKCVITELESLGKELSGAVFIAKRFQLRSCNHGRNVIAATECVMSLIGEVNPHHYFVASQDPELRRLLRRVAGVPLLHIIRNTIVLEKPTDTSHHKADELVAAKVEPSEYQKTILDRLSAEAGGKDKTDTPRKRKRKEPKGPNPLSIKKSTKMRTGRKMMSLMGGVTQSKKRRQRLQIRRAIEALSKVTHKEQQDVPQTATTMLIPNTSLNIK